jgi:hypothetical protein
MTAEPITTQTGEGYPALQTEIWGINEDKGWHEDGFNPREARALIHSEISEALEAYRSHGLVDQTDHYGSHDTLPKPEGVGSEFADVLIRVLHYQARSGVVAVEPDEADLAVARAVHYGRTFGEDIDLLHEALACGPLASFPAHLVTVAQKHGIDLMAEVRRKIDFNRTRPYRHGGKKL